MNVKRQDAAPGATGVSAPSPSPVPAYEFPHDSHSHSHRHTHASGATQSLQGTPVPTGSGGTATVVDSQAPATSSANVQLSSTTIVALGMGFIGAALLVVGITILLRVHIVARAAQRQRANGENVTFRDMWDRWGGIWGLLFAPGEQFGRWESGVVVRRKKVGPPPKMWDVDVAKLEPRDEFDMDDEGVQPLAAAPYYAPGSNVPECAFSVLVVMPVPPAPPRSLRASISSHNADSSNGGGEVDEEEEEPTLPDIMLGTTHLRPTIPLAEAGIKGDESDKDDTELEYVYPVHELALMRTRSHAHWATVWGIDAHGRIP